MKNIGQKKVLEIPFLRPPLREQHEFEKRMKHFKAVCSNVGKNQSAASSLFAFLQHRGFRGEF